MSRITEIREFWVEYNLATEWEDLTEKQKEIAREILRRAFNV